MKSWIVALLIVCSIAVGCGPSTRSVAIEQPVAPVVDTSLGVGDSFDQVTDMDRTFDSHGVKLVVDQMSLQYLAGTTVDYVEGLQGAGFKFVNPNVKSTCGCGSSFSV